MQRSARDRAHGPPCPDTAQELRFIRTCDDVCRHARSPAFETGSGPLYPVLECCNKEINSTNTAHKFEMHATLKTEMHTLI